MLRTIVLSELSVSQRQALLRRSAVPDAKVRRRAAEICEAVRVGGDAALAEAASRFGGGRSGPMVVGRDEMDQALAGLPTEVTAALESAIGAVQHFHQAQLPADLTVETAPGVEVSRVWAPLARVGAYVPGGRAAYPSTLIMTVVPAKVAGVNEVVVASPADPDGSLSPALLAAATLTGVDELYVMGGAQAVAALAYGTDSIRPVQKVVGPGNAWVTAAKLHVFGECAVDLPAGPSEVLVLADRSADPDLVAADLLCQAEHGPDSPAVLVTTDPALVAAVEEALRRHLPSLARRQILATSIGEHGLAIVAADQTSAIAFANEYAAEHVTILTEDPEADAKAITGAGSVFVGRWSPESAGDYATGANHVLPTGGLAGACGPLSVEEFGSWRQVQRLTRDGLAILRPTIAALADAEGLAAHRLAAEIRFSRTKP